MLFILVQTEILWAETSNLSDRKVWVDAAYDFTRVNFKTSDYQFTGTIYLYLEFNSISFVDKIKPQREIDFKEKCFFPVTILFNFEYFNDCL